MRYLFFLIYLLFTSFVFSNEQEQLILSSPEQIASFSDETHLIGGVVSPLSGQICLKQVDLNVPGTQRIALERIYVSPEIPVFDHKHKKHQKDWDALFLYRHLQNYVGWQFFPQLKLQTNTDFDKMRVSNPHAVTLDFHVSDHSTTLASSPYGVSNCMGDIPHGKYDQRNTRIIHENDKIKVFSPDGSTRIYSSKIRSIDQTSKILTCYLEKEILPNGKILRYSYDDTRLISIESLDPQERYIYATLQAQGKPWENHWHFISSSGSTVDYNYEIRTFKGKIKQKTKQGTTTDYLDYRFPPILTNVSSPSYRQELSTHSDHFLLSGFSGKEDIFKCNYKAFGDKQKVHQLLFPIGEHDQFQGVYEFNYDPPIAGQKEGSTTIKYPDQTKVIYQFHSNLLTKSIQFYDPSGSLKKEKIYIWTDKQWLQSIELFDGQKQRLYQKTFEYDFFGNPILETFIGNLTGEQQQETYTIKRAFSQDGRNLLIKEENEEGKIVCFQYLPNTNLLTCKLTKDKDHIFLREFYLYDDCNNLIQRIADDGQGIDPNDLQAVTQRTITNYILRQHAPFLHMPDGIEEKYLENGLEKLLKRKQLTYDSNGNVCKEDIFDANGSFAYSIFKEYNERGDLLSETNSIGQKATYAYDLKGQCIQSINFANKLQKQMIYDAKGRLKHQKEIDIEGTVHTTSFGYDSFDHLIQKTDTFDNTTHYLYDSLTHQRIQQTSPAIESLDGKALSVTTFSNYDALGREITRVDANGNRIEYVYNACGSPIEIKFADGSKESFTYFKNGKLKSHINQDGLTINYTYDILGRVTLKKYSSIAQESFTYNSYHLLQERDKEGNLTNYVYDGAGRKIHEEKCGRTIDLTYDPLGRLSTLCKSKVLFTHYQRDLLNRIIEETDATDTGVLLYKISYAYDKAGNQSAITRYINGQEATQTFAYDSFNRLIEHRDALGLTSKTFYNEKKINSLRQTVLQVITIDPKNISTLKTYDPYERLAKIEILNPNQSLINQQEMFYDSNGNLILQKNHIYEGITYKKTHITQFTYNTRNQLDSSTRSFGTSDERQTTYAYTPFGKMSSKTLPSGVTLFYEYDPLGFLKDLKSSDGTLHHCFAYNRLGNLLYTSDELQNITIQREIDAFGNVLKEKFPNFEIEKSYDDFDRLTTLKIADQGQIHYTYDPLYLRTITRVSNKGSIQYEHKYDYDLDGNIIAEKMIGDLGQITHRNDLNGRKKSILSPYFSQHCNYDEKGNLTQQTLDANQYTYSYDEFNQLTSENFPSAQLTYTNDSLYTRIQKNASSYQVNELNELTSFGRIQCKYDLNGNLIEKQTPTENFQFTYDVLNRLTDAEINSKHIHFTYDPLGRRLSKTTESTQEYYLYDDIQEIGACTSTSELKQLRILGFSKALPTTIALELNGQIFAPIQDAFGNILSLIDINTKTRIRNYTYSAFGEEIKVSLGETPFNPWRYASKRLDPELKLIYFGNRYYDPGCGRWITTDPAGFVDGMNLYQYVFNNPFCYVDPDGQFLQFVIPFLAWGAEAVLPAISTYVAPVILGVLTGAASYGGYQLVKALNASYRTPWDLGSHYVQNVYKTEVEEKKKHNTNPFDGPVNEDVVIVDEAGNAIQVPQGNWLTGSKDGKWIQEVKPGKTPDGQPTGTRKDGGHPHGPKHNDPRALEPHSHVPGVTNPDGTPWLPVKK